MIKPSDWSMIDPPERKFGTCSECKTLTTVATMFNGICSSCHATSSVQEIIQRAHGLSHAQKLEEALGTLDLVFIFDPDNILARILRSSLLRDLKRTPEAIACCKEGLAIDPSCHELSINLGTLYLDEHRFQEALDRYQEALTIHPDFVPALINAGAALHALGRHDEAVASFERAYELDPTQHLALSSVCGLLDYVPGTSYELAQAKRKLFATNHCNIEPRVLTPNKYPGRKLIIGYVSADFRHHSLASCLLPILQRHDKSQFKLILYSGVLCEDDWTREFRALADEFVVCYRLSDSELADRIIADKVDILVDLSSHSVGNRLLTFAHKPAPVQVTAWGQASGTGLPQIDYLFGDPVLIPQKVRHLFAEEIWDLPCAIGFQAPKGAPEIGELPFLRNGYLTYGYLGRWSKVEQDCARTWANILKDKPDSRLILKDFTFDVPEARDKTMAVFEGLGIKSERITLNGSSSRLDHLNTYNEIDLTLDTFPMNGGITTWEALWMGCPVVTLIGEGPASARSAAAILCSLDLGSWVTRGIAQYCFTALDIDPENLANFRKSIRKEILNSESGNPDNYTRAVESAYCAMWRRYCAAS